MLGETYMVVLSSEGASLTNAVTAPLGGAGLLYAGPNGPTLPKGSLATVWATGAPTLRYPDGSLASGPLFAPRAGHKRALCHL